MITSKPTISRRLRRMPAALLACAMVVAVVAGGCGRAGPAASEPPAAISQTYTVGSREGQPEVAVTLTADRSSMTVADRLTMVLTIDASEQATVTWEPPTIPEGETAPAKFGDFTVAAVAMRPVEQPTAAERRITEYTLVLEPFLEGEKSIPALKIPVRSGSGADLAITTEPIKVTVAPVVPPEEVEQAQWSPTRDPLATPILKNEGDPVIASVAAVLLGAWLGAFAWAALTAHRGRREINPVELARQRLSALRERLAQIQADPYSPQAMPTRAIAADLALVVREYLDRHLRVPALGATAAQLPARLSSSSLAPDLRSDVAESLAALERSAFAPEQPRTAELQPHLELAERLVAYTAASESREVAA